MAACWEPHTDTKDRKCQPTHQQWPDARRPILSPSPDPFPGTSRHVKSQFPCGYSLPYEVARKFAFPLRALAALRSCTSNAQPYSPPRKVALPLRVLAALRNCTSHASRHSPPCKVALSLRVLVCLRSYTSHVYRYSPPCEDALPPQVLVALTKLHYPAVSKQTRPDRHTDSHTDGQPTADAVAVGGDAIAALSITLFFVFVRILLCLLA